MPTNVLHEFEKELNQTFDKYYKEKEALNDLPTSVIKRARWMKTTVKKAIEEGRFLIKKYAANKEELNREMQAIYMEHLKQLMKIPLPTNIGLPKRITYKSEIDDRNVLVHYYLDIRPKDKLVWWGFHPTLPEGMHWKKGDENGLGSDHSDGKQLFEEFFAKPKYEIPEEDYINAMEFILAYTAEK